MACPMCGSPMSTAGCTKEGCVHNNSRKFGDRCSVCGSDVGSGGCTNPQCLLGVNDGPSLPLKIQASNDPEMAKAIALERIASVLERIDMSSVNKILSNFYHEGSSD